PRRRGHEIPRAGARALPGSPRCRLNLRLMRVDVFFTPQEVAASDVVNRVVAIVDVLRASTSITVALANGARAVIPMPSSEEVVSRAKSLARTGVRLAGARK